MANSKWLYSDITEMYDAQGLSADEIAGIMGIPKSLVENVIDDYEHHLDIQYGAY
jgi:DNA-directed RNA polymerase specialized sigma24 family protein